MCACTEPVRTGIGAVCVEYGGPKRPITMLNSTDTYRKLFRFYFWHPMLVRPAMKNIFSPEGKKRPRSLRSLGLASLARSAKCKPCPMALVPDSTVHCSRPPARNLDLWSSDHALGPWVGFIYIKTTMLCFSHYVICKVKKVFIVILIPKPSLNFRTG